MSITLNNGTTTVTLPTDLLWTDEFNWSSIVEQVDVSITGALLIQESQELSGRPITLTGGQDYAWIDRTTLLALRAMAEVTGAVMTLTLNDASTYIVRFYRQGSGSSSSGNNPSPIQAAPITPNNNPEGTDWYSLVLYLMEIPST